MSLDLRQWDVVRVRINATDKDEHPAVVISPDGVLAGRPARINVLYGTSRRPNMEVREHHAVLNGAEGLENPTLVSCAHFYQVAPLSVVQKYGRVGVARRKEIIRKIIAAFGLTP